jgi:hypothetical protein
VTLKIPLHDDEQRARRRERQRAAAKRWRDRHPEKRKAASKRWRNANRNRFNESRRVWRANNIERALFMEAKSRSKRRGTEFTIRLEDIPPIGTHCPLLGVPFSPAHSGDAFAPSLDRLDSRFGYVPGNVWIVTRRANLIKNDGTAAEHEAIARAMRGRGVP